MLFGITLKAVKSTEDETHFAGKVVKHNRANLSMKEVKRTEIITSDLEEIRSEYLRTYFTKDGVLKLK